MDAPPPVEDEPRLPRSFWVAIALLAAASMVRLLTFQASMQCLRSPDVALLAFPYGFLLLLVFLFRATPPASAVVAAGTVVITVLPLTLGLGIAAAAWSDATVYCGEGGLRLFPGLFALFQVVAAILVGLLAVAVWFFHVSGARPRSGTITGR